MHQRIGFNNVHDGNDNQQDSSTDNVYTHCINACNCKGPQPMPIEDVIKDRANRHRQHTSKSWRTAPVLHGPTLTPNC